MKKLPAGIQNIQDILSDNYVYVDKTAYFLKLMNLGKHFFLSRPRRFGKSLFLDTLAEILSGNKELLKNCAIASTDYGWKVYPVLQFNFSEHPTDSSHVFKQSLEETAEEFADEFKITIKSSFLTKKLSSLIRQLSKKNPVVILIDEYDKPITDHIRNLELAKQNRQVIEEFFSTLKALDKHIKFTFVTGITKFPLSSLFSGPNHLTDLNMKEEFADLIGFTEKEILTYFDEHIAHVAKERNLSHEEVFQELKQWYNGYRFTSKEVKVFNPYSTLLYFQDKKPESYWYNSGTPNFLVEQLSKNIYENIAISKVEVSSASLGDINQVDSISLPSLLYQSGYLTIVNAYPNKRSYMLDFPNKEVRDAFNMTLVQAFSSKDPYAFIKESQQIRQYLQDLDLASFIQAMQRHYAKIPYQILSQAQEGVYHILMLSYLELMELKPFAEVPTNQGRIDLFCEDEKQVYVIELKVNKSADLALQQIDEKNYMQRFEGKDKQLLAIGINFDTQERNISDWRATLYDSKGKNPRILDT